MYNSYEEIKQIMLTIPDEKPIIIAGHQNVDMDSIGSCLALTRYLTSLGKNCVMLLEEKDVTKLNWFADYTYITNQIECTDYVFILLDANEKSRLGIFEKYFDHADMTINIDHHENNKNQADHILTISEISSTSEMIYTLLNLFEKKINKQQAELLYAGIITDTSCFMKRTTPRTLQIAGELLAYGIDSNKITRETCFKLTKGEEKVLAYMIENIKYDKFHYIIVDKEKDIYQEIEWNTILKKFMYVLENIEDIEILAIFKLENNKVTVEFRSNSKIDVDKLGIKLGGGGHKKAAGVTDTNKSIQEIMNETKKYLEYYQE